MYLVYSGWLDRFRKRYFEKLLGKCGLGNGSLLLDYGCGPGDLLLIARDAGIEATGVDSFPRSVELAAERGLSVILGDADSESLSGRQFDAIVLQSVIEHIDKPLETLEKLLVHLKPGGSLLVSAPTPGPHFWDDPTHIRPYTPASLHTLGELLGLEVRQVSYVFSFLLGFSMSNSIMYKLMNQFPFPMGSNLIAIYTKAADA